MLRPYLMPFVTSKAVLLHTHPMLVEKAAHIAELLRDCCGYTLLASPALLLKFLAERQQAPDQRVYKPLLMPTCIYTHKDRQYCYDMLRRHGIGPNDIGCVALTAEEADLKSAKVAFDKIVKAEFMQINREFTTLIRGEEETETLKSFIATLLTHMV